MKKKQTKQICPKCKKRYRNYPQAYCTNCRSKVSKKHYNENKERKNFLQKIADANRKARDYNIKGELTEQEVKQLKDKTGDYCPACGNKFDDTRKGQWTIDHIIPFINFTCVNQISNIQIICYRCNRKKWTEYINYGL